MILPSSSLLNLHERIKNATSLRNKDNIPEQVWNLHQTNQLPAVIAVSKLVPAKIIRSFYLAGQRNFGESYLQEFLIKFHELKDCTNDIVWHFIGPIQSNKLKKIAQYFDWIHSVDSYKIAHKLSEFRQTFGNKKTPLNICLQININGESNKRGIKPENAIDQAKEISSLPRIRLRGLMTIPQATNNYDEQLQNYKNLATIFNEMTYAGIKMDTISAGMSNDFEAAIAAGSTMVRIGSLLFGQRAIKTKEMP